mgnify:CR=1 FL=1
MGYPVVDGGFGCIIADPPWSFDDKGSRAAPDWKEHTLYQTMDARSIVDMPVELLAADNAHLYIWTTDVHLPLALAVMEAWGFNYKKTLAWVKRQAATSVIQGEEQVLRGPLHIGMGHYYRTAKELVLFGTRGRAPALVHNLPDVFEGPRTQHSRKPDTLHEWAEKLSPGPRLELFARRSREGWEAWGDQFPGHSEYVRHMQDLNKHRKQARAVMTRKEINRRNRIAWDSLVMGVAKFPGRCHCCRDLIRQGENVHYDPAGSGRVCGGCMMGRYWEERAGEEVAP